MKRECGTCTKCCEGWLTGEALGHNFYPGKPCHFLAVNKGCTVYAKRPKDPCSSYKCAWLANEDIALIPGESKLTVKLPTTRFNDYKKSIFQKSSFFKQLVSLQRPSQEFFHKGFFG